MFFLLAREPVIGSLHVRRDQHEFPQGERWTNVGRPSEADEPSVTKCPGMACNAGALGGPGGVAARGATLLLTRIGPERLHIVSHLSAERLRLNMTARACSSAFSSRPSRRRAYNPRDHRALACRAQERRIIM